MSIYNANDLIGKTIRSISPIENKYRCDRCTVTFTDGTTVVLATALSRESVWDGNPDSANYDVYGATLGFYTE